MPVVFMVLTFGKWGTESGKCHYMKTGMYFLQDIE